MKKNKEAGFESKSGRENERGLARGPREVG